MASIIPTKELLQMIEERIPGGRVLTTAALLLAVLAIIVGSCGYLYRALVLPAIGLVVTLVTTGKINPSALGKFAVSVAFTASVYFTFEWLHRGSSRLMKEMLDQSKDILKRNDEVLSLAQQANEQMIAVTNAVQDLDARVTALEEGEK
jgi:hypothetical protein